jgi:hypothetical protein
MHPERIVLGKYSEAGLDRILATGLQIGDAGQRIEFLSGHFLGVRYGESSLIGDAGTPEVFVVNLGEVDCMTFLEYVEAMRRSSSFSQFTEQLKEVRYRSGRISFAQRNHFFTDWVAYQGAYIEDVTAQAGQNRATKIRKILNQKEDGTALLAGIEAAERDISYIPPESLDHTLIATLRTGDYLGIYSPQDGLDVSHVGILVREGGGVFFRHASALEEHRRVVDQEFAGYIADKPGILVFRSR